MDHIHIKNKQAVRKFIEAVWYVIRSGCQWRLLPEYYGKWRTIHKRFKSWSDKKIWKNIMEQCVNSDEEYAIIDTTIVRSHACSAGFYKYTSHKEALGRSVGGFTTKIHALVDSLGNPLKFILTPGNKHDIAEAKNLLKDSNAAYVLADRGYHSKALSSFIKSKNAFPVIPSKSNSKNPESYDKIIYKERHLVENFFSKIKQFRRIFSRFDKYADTLWWKIFYLIDSKINTCISAIQ